MRFSRRLRAIGEIAFAMAFVLQAAPALAQAEPSQKAWQMATEYPPSSVSGAGLATFAKLLATRTGGAVTATAAFDNELKVSSSDMPRAAKEGRITGGD